MRASNVIYDVPEGRPVWKTAPIRLGVTVVTMILLAAAAMIVVVTGGLARKVGNVLASARQRSPSGTSRNGQCY